MTGRHLKEILDRGVSDVQDGDVGRVIDRAWSVADKRRRQARVWAGVAATGLAAGAISASGWLGSVLPAGTEADNMPASSAETAELDTDDARHTTTTPGPSATTTAEKLDESATQVPTAADLEMARHLSLVALDPSPETVRMLSVAPPGLALGLGPELLRTVEPGDLATTDAWELEHPAGLFRGRVGPFSALQALRMHLETVGGGSVDGLAVTVGEHPRCAGPAEAPPAEVRDLRRVAIQPAPDVYSSCLQWFSLDIYVDKAGAIHAITLDLWEP